LSATDTSSTRLSTLSLHDALPISAPRGRSQLDAFFFFLDRLGEHVDRFCQPDERRAEVDLHLRRAVDAAVVFAMRHLPVADGIRSEEHTSELQSRGHLVCRLLLEK